MRQIMNLNRKWAFTKDAQQNPAQLPAVQY